jgi:HAD superfamily hydrolase (TIGR01450 family)
VADNFLKNVRCFLLDLDGTLTLDDKLLPGALELLSTFRRKGLVYCLITNNSSKSKKTYLKKLAQVGLNLSSTELITSGEVTGKYLSNHHAGAKIFVLGTPDLVQELEGYGFESDEKNPDILVLGFDTTLTYEKLNRFCDLLRKGKPFLATHSDINCPTTNGFIPDIGAMMALIQASTGRTPDVIMGKPFLPLVNFLSEQTGLKPAQMCMIGDRLYTDMAMGKHGVHTMLVLTGETKRTDLLEAAQEPEKVIEDLWELIKLIEILRIG